jgi:hypothetical protein
MHMALARRHLTRLLLVVTVLLFPVWPAGATSPPAEDGRSGQLAPSPALPGLVQVVLRDQAPTRRVAADKRDRPSPAGLVLLGVLVAVARTFSQPQWLAGRPRSFPSPRSFARPDAVGPRAPPPLQFV